MVNPELEKYVETSLKGNMEPANIRRILIAAGWNPHDVDEAIAAKTGQAQPAASPAAVAAANAASGASAAATTSQPATANPTATSAYSATKPRKNISKKSLLVGVGVLLLVLAAGITGYAFYTGKLSLGGGLSDAELLAKLPENLQEIKSANYEGSLELVAEARAANAVPFIVRDYQYTAPAAQPADQPTDIGSGDDGFGGDSLVELIEQSYTQLPTEIEVRAAFGGTTLNSESVTADTAFHGGVDVKLGDFNVSADVDFLKKDSSAYFRVNKFPSLFLDLAAIKGRWVKITQDDLAVSGLNAFFDGRNLQNLLDSNQEHSQKMMEQALLAYKIAAEEGVMANKSPATSEKLNGENTRHFRLGLVKEKILPFYIRATKELKDKYGEEAIMEFDPATADYLASPAFGKLAEYLAANTDLDLWLNSKTGQIVKYTYALRFVPPPEIEKLKDIQYMLRLAFALKDINQPLQITAPTETMSFEEAEALIGGKSVEEVRAEKQVNNIISLRTALETYHSYAKKYPDNLEALTITYLDLYRLGGEQLSADSNSFYSSVKLVEKIPLDIYTKQPYKYTRGTNDYVIEYAVNLPPAFSSVYLTDVANGLNHANSTDISREKP